MRNLTLEIENKSNVLIIETIKKNPLSFIVPMSK